MSSFDANPEQSLPRRWQYGTIPVVGLTGAIGGGKSRFAALLGQHGAALIDADSVGHEVLEVPIIQQQLVDRFGPGVLRPEGPEGDPRIDRKFLGAIVFADPKARRALEAVVHPEMVHRFETAIGRETRRGLATAIVLDAAILFEAGWDRLCDLTVFVDAPFPVRLERVARDRGWNAEALRAREAAQWPIDVKRRRANLRIGNDASLEALEQNAQRLLTVVTGSAAADSFLEKTTFVGHSCEPVAAASGDPR